MFYRLSLLLVLACIMGSSGYAGTAGLTDTIEKTYLLKDIVLVLDNSGSMKKNDPEFLAKQAVAEFIERMDASTKVSIIIFDQDIKVVAPLTDASPEAKEDMLQSISGIDYTGQLTNSPAAIERAIYDLKNGGRSDAKKIIIFMTDGIVDTGNEARDLEKTKWLKEYLATDAADSEIHIFGIAFTENADFELIQSLAQKTKGEYYRALEAEYLQTVFDKLYALINQPPELEELPEVLEPQPPEPAPPVIVRVAPPVQDDHADIMMIISLSVLAFSMVIVLLVLLSNRRKSVSNVTAPDAFLRDIQGVTTHDTFKLSNKPTMLGRVAGKDTKRLSYLVIQDNTIGRRHSLIEYKDFAYWIIDQGSINGTFVNDAIIEGAVRLKHGDRIHLHKIEFEFLMPEMADSDQTIVSGEESSEQPTLFVTPDQDQPDAESGSMEFDIDPTPSGIEETILSDTEEAVSDGADAMVPTNKQETISVAGTDETVLTDTEEAGTDGDGTEETILSDTEEAVSDGADATVPTNKQETISVAGTEATVLSDTEEAGTDGDDGDGTEETILSDTEEAVSDGIDATVPTNKQETISAGTEAIVLTDTEEAGTDGDGTEETILTNDGLEGNKADDEDSRN